MNLHSIFRKITTKESLLVEQILGKGRNLCNNLNSHINNFNPHTPIAQKIADEVVFRRFQGEGVDFS